MKAFGWRYAVAALAAVSGQAVAQSQAVPDPAMDPAAPSTASQDAGATNQGDVIVTALRRTQRLQDVPASVTVAEGEALSRSAITSLDQITQAVPGIRIQAAPGGAVNPVVRGLGTSASNDSFEQTIGLFIDGVFAGHNRDYSASLFDIDRVEVVKGTQASILGKNTSVGALTLSTRQPTGELAIQANYLHDFELGSDLFDAAINLPVGERLAIRVAGQYTDEGGWVRNDLIGGSEPRLRRRAIRASARLQVTDAIDWTLSGQFYRINRAGQSFYAGLDTLGRLRATAALYGDPNFTAGVNDRSRNGPRAGTDGTFDKTRGFRLTSTLNIALGERILTALSGYSEFRNRHAINVNSVANTPVLRDQTEDNESFSQELRLTSPSGGALKYILGAYYYYDRWDNGDLLDVLPQAGTPVNGGVQTNQDYRTESISAFGQVGYEITPQLEATVGLRYDDQDKRVDYLRVTTRPGLLATAVFAPFAPTRLGRNDSFVNYAASLQYRFDRNAQLYVSYATGDKGGSYQATPTNLATAGFGPEGAKTLEIGGKFTLAPGTNINLAVFDTDVSDYQISINTGTAFVVRNDQIRSRGIDLDINLRATPELSFGASATYADVEKRGPVPANSTRDLPFAPEFSGIAQVTLDTPMSDALRFTANALMEFRTEQRVIDLANALVPTSGGYAKLNARLAVSHAASGVEVALVGKNLTDRRVVNYSFNAFLQAGAAIIATDPSRVIALQLSIRR